MRAFQLVAWQKPPEFREVPVGRWIDDEPRVLYTAHELTYRYLGLQPCQRTTETEVDTATITQVLVVLALDIYLVGVLEAVRIAVCRPIHYDDWRTLRNCRPSKLYIL